MSPGTPEGRMNRSSPLKNLFLLLSEFGKIISLCVVTLIIKTPNPIVGEEDRSKRVTKSHEGQKQEQ